MKEDKELDKKREAFQIWQQEAESLVELVRQRWGAANEAPSSEGDANGDGETSANNDTTPQDKEISDQVKEEQPVTKKRKLSHSDNTADGEDNSTTADSSVNGINDEKKAAEKRAALESFRQQAEMLGNLARGQKIDDIVQTWGLQQINAIIGDLRKMKQMLGAL